MVIKTRTFLPKIVLGVIAAIVLSSGIYVGANAAYGRNNNYQGYFSGIQRGPGGQDVLPGLRCGADQYNGIPIICDALPVNEINNVRSLVDLLRRYNSSGDRQRVTGSAFVVYTMLGRPGGNNTPRQVSSDDFNELTDRLNYAQSRQLINWLGFSQKDINSLWQGPGVDDDAFFDGRDSQGNLQSGFSIIIYNDGPFTGGAAFLNGPAYELMRECANPLGRTDEGIPKPPNFRLDPDTNIDNLTAEKGEQIDVGSTVGNDNPQPGTRGGSSPDTTKWELTKLVYGPGADPRNRAQVMETRDACEYYGGDCDTLRDGTRSFPLGPTTLPDTTFTVPDDAAPGTEICFVLSVKPGQRTNSGIDNRWIHSAPTCSIVGKSPKLQVWGGDIRAGGKIETSTSTLRGDTYGSWVEYGALAAGSINRFGSGSAYNGSGENPAKNNLTFSNVPTGGSVGNYANSVSSSGRDLLTQQFNLSSSPLSSRSSSVTGLSSKKYDVGGGTFTITSGNVGQDGSSGRGKTIIIQSTGTVKITGNISYKGPSGGDDFTNLGQLPQLIIIAKNIIIGDNVTNIDAWLIAQENVNTCSTISLPTPAEPNLSSSTCNTRLKINGPVYAKHLYTFRTAGSDTVSTAKDPAEVFNLRSDAFAWGKLNSAGADRVQTVYTNELPPRF